MCALCVCVRFFFLKATLCAIQILRKVPDLVEDFMHGALSLLEDKSHGPLLAALSLIIHVIDLDKRAKKKVRKVFFLFLFY